MFEKKSIKISKIKNKSLAVSAWGEAPLRLDKFTAPDRASVIRLLLNDARVQSALSRRRQEATTRDTTKSDTTKAASLNKNHGTEHRSESRPEPAARVSWMGAPGNSIC
jgi:hypothetical protein